jgi:hypothetical protein
MIQVNYGKLLWEEREDVMSAEECLREALRVNPQHPIHPEYTLNAA